MSRISPADVTPPNRTKDNVMVVCRFRPQNERENAEGGFRVVEVEPKTASGQNVKLTTTAEGKHTFTFDRVFDTNTTQAEVYEGAASVIVESVMDGYNGTVFAYGQTGSGKTFTMEGPDIRDEGKMGIIPRMVTHVFDMIGKAPLHIEFTVKVSMIEIYLEHIRDLLDTSKTNLSVHEDKIRGIYVENATEEYVASPAEVYDVMKYGASLRATASTNMNAVSSRSHSIFLMEIKQRDTKTEAVKTGKLFLVDLAGSEKVRKTGASGDRLEEAKNINKSLAALGNVINALTDENLSHIPYRDSKLTRILQQSLGGNSRTCLVLACSPSSWNDQETLSTLRFGSRAKMIKNRATINQEFTAAQLKLMLAEANAEIDRLRSQLASAGITTDGPPLQSDEEKWNLMKMQDALLEQLKDKTTEAEQAIAEAARAKAELERSAHSHTLERENLMQQIEILKRENGDLERRVGALDDTVNRMQHELEDKDRMIEMLTVPVVEETDATLKEDKITELEALVEMQRAELRELHRIQASDGSHKASLADVLGAKEVENERYKGRIKEQEARCARLVANNRQHQEREKQFQLIVKQLNDAHSRLKSDFNRSLQEALDKHMKALQGVMDERDAFARKSETLQSQVDELNTSLVKLQMDIKDRCDKVIELEMELDREKDATESMLERGGAKDPKALKKTIDFLQRNLEQYSNVSQQLLIENHQLTHRVTSLDRQFETHRSLLEDLTDRFSSILNIVNSTPAFREALIGKGVSELDLEPVTLPEIEEAPTPPPRLEKELNTRMKGVNISATETPRITAMPSSTTVVGSAIRAGVVDMPPPTAYHAEAEAHKPRIVKPMRGGGGTAPPGATFQRNSFESTPTLPVTRVEVVGGPILAEPQKLKVIPVSAGKPPEVKAVIKAVAK